MKAARSMQLVVFGLSLSSSWGNSHAATYRALLRAFAERGHLVTFLERNQPWYADNRDLANPRWARLICYDSIAELEGWSNLIQSADAVIIGSDVPEGIAVGDFVQRMASGVTAFYDIDTPVTLAALERGDCTYLSPELIPGYNVYLSRTGGPTLELLERRYHAPAARPLYCSVDTEIYRPLDEPKRWDLSYLGTYSPGRQPLLEKLLIGPARRSPHLKFAVAGSQYPADIDWPANVERLEHIALAGHPAFYAASRWTLNVTRADRVKAGFSPSVRLFEASACATPIISDCWQGLDHFFKPGRDIWFANNSDDVLAALALPEAERCQLGKEGLGRIRAAHSARHRARQLEYAIMEAAVAAPSKLRPGFGAGFDMPAVPRLERPTA